MATKKDILLLLWKKLTKNFGDFCNFQKLSTANNRPKGEK
jgi:hypothetical protein